MMGHKIRFNGKTWKIIPKLSLLSLLIWSTAQNLGRMQNHLGRLYMKPYVLYRSLGRKQEIKESLGRKSNMTESLSRKGKLLCSKIYVGLLYAHNTQMSKQTE